MAFAPITNGKYDGKWDAALIESSNKFCETEVNYMQHDSPNVIAVNLLEQTVESKGCHLSEVDIENMIIRVNGPDDVVSDCARVVAEILD